MSSPADRQEELRDLLRQLSDGPLSPEESGRLNELLHGDAVACELYLDHLTLDARLRHEFGGRPPLPEEVPAFARASEAPRAQPGKEFRFVGLARFAAAAERDAHQIRSTLAIEVFEKERVRQ